MIVTMLFELTIGFFDLLQPMEADFSSLMAALDYIGVFFAGGVDFLVMIAGKQTVSILGIYLGLILVLDVFYLTYQMLWWFIKKIPLLDISQ